MCSIPLTDSKLICAENQAPRIVNSGAVLEVKLGASYTSLLTLRATDGDGDSLSFTLGTAPPPGLSIHKDSGLIAWLSVPDLSTAAAAAASVQFWVTDGKVAILWTPTVKFCKCQVRARHAWWMAGILWSNSLDKLLTN